MAAAVVRTPGFGVRAVAPLFGLGVSTPFGMVSGREWDLDRIDGRFVVPRRNRAAPDGIRVVLGWTRELLREAAR